jgi:hypothetical protein
MSDSFSIVYTAPGLGLTPPIPLRMFSADNCLTCSEVRVCHRVRHRSEDFYIVPGIRTVVTGINARYAPAPALIDEYLSICAEGVQMLLSSLVEEKRTYLKTVHISTTSPHSPTMLPCFLLCVVDMVGLHHRPAAGASAFRTERGAFLAVRGVSSQRNRPGSRVL